MREVFPNVFRALCGASFGMDAEALRNSALEFLKGVAKVATSWLQSSSEWTPASEAAIALLRNHCGCYFGGSVTAITGVVRNVVVGRRLLRLLTAENGPWAAAAALLRSLPNETAEDKTGLKQAIISTSRMVVNVVPVCPTEERGSVPGGAEAAQELYSALCSRVLGLSDKVRSGLMMVLHGTAQLPRSAGFEGV